MRCLDLALAPPRVHPAGTVAADLPAARQPEVVLLPRHAGHDAADARPAAEVPADAGDHRRHAAGRVAEAERREHGEEDAAALGETTGGHWMSSSARASTEGGIVSPSAFAVLRLMINSNFVG